MSDHTRENAGFQLARSGLFEVLATIAFVFVSTQILGETALPTSYGTGLVLATAPALIWLSFIYRQDRLNPEPPSLVLTTFIVAGLLAWGIGHPLTETVFSRSEWRYSNQLSQWVAAIAIMGLIHQLIAYLAIRFTVFQTTDLDEPVDAIVYAAASTLGVATATTLRFVVSHDGILPLAGTSWIAGVVLIHVASALPLGLGIAHRRMHASGFLLTLFFAASVVVNGGLTEVLGVYGRQDGQLAPWRIVAMASGMALAILVIGGRLSHGLRGAKTHTDLTRPMGSSLRVDFLLWPCAAALFIGALVFADSQTPAAEQKSVFSGKVSVTVPAGWTSHETKTSVLIEKAALDVLSTKVEIRPVSKGGGLGTLPLADALLLEMEQERRSRGAGYRTLRVEERPAFGVKTTMWSHSAYLAESHPDAPSHLPTLMQGLDIVVSMDHAPQYIIRASWPAGSDEVLAQELLKSVRISK